tara:strand:- start:294 stop:584 length:291 start_codon:yes stop_codon:yes gene_type:complete
MTGLCHHLSRLQIHPYRHCPTDFPFLAIEPESLLPDLDCYLMFLLAQILLRCLSIGCLAPHPVPRGLIHLCLLLARVADPCCLNSPTADFPQHCSD